jgi:addiction module RelE/StbE family toxin
LAQIVYSEQALSDLDRLTDFLVDTDPTAALATTRLITEAVQILANHPHVGRPVESGLRELVISRGRSGYLALYSYEESADIAFVWAVRHQREAGYASE